MKHVIDTVRFPFSLILAPVGVLFLVLWDSELRAEWGRDWKEALGI